MQHDGAYFNQLEAKIKNFGTTTAGARWVSKALHPVVGPPCQIPDETNIATLNPEYKLETQVSAPAGLTGTSWDMCVLIPPSDRVHAIVMSGESGCNFYLGPASPAVQRAQFSMASSGVVAGSGYPYWNQAMSGGAITAGVGSYYQALSAELPSRWRTTARSLTAYMTASDLYNGGTVYAGQYAREVVPAPSGVIDPIIGPSGWVALNVDLVDLPLSEADMAIMTPGFYTAPAKEGVYMPIRLTGPAQTFTEPRSSARYIDVSSAKYVVPATPGWSTQSTDTMSVFKVRSATDYSAVSVTPDFSFNSAHLINTFNDASTGFDKACAWGVVIFRGLHPAATITLKTVLNVEIMPKVMAPARQYVTDSARYDPQALLAYRAIAAEMPHAMAARHNFLSTLLPILSGVASKVLPHLLPALGAGASAIIDRLRAPPVAPPPRPALAPPPMVPRRATSVASSRRSTRSVKIKVARKKRVQGRKNK